MGDNKTLYDLIFNINSLEKDILKKLSNKTYLNGKSIEDISDSKIFIDFESYIENEKLHLKEYIKAVEKYNHLKQNKYINGKIFSILSYYINWKIIIEQFTGYGVEKHNTLFDNYNQTLILIIEYLKNQNNEIFELIERNYRFVSEKLKIYQFKNFHNYINFISIDKMCNSCKYGNSEIIIAKREKFDGYCHSCFKEDDDVEILENKCTLSEIITLFYKIYINYVYESILNSNSNIFISWKEYTKKIQKILNYKEYKNNGYISRIFNLLLILKDIDFKNFHEFYLNKQLDNKETIKVIDYYEKKNDILNKTVDKLIEYLVCDFCKMEKNMISNEFILKSGCKVHHNNILCLIVNKKHFYCECERDYDQKIKNELIEIQKFSRYNWIGSVFNEILNHILNN